MSKKTQADSTNMNADRSSPNSKFVNGWRQWRYRASLRLRGRGRAPLIDVQPFYCTWRDSVKILRETAGMVYVIAQLSDIHVGGPNEGSGDRFSAALEEINAMARQPDLVLLTGDNTHNGTDEEWQEVTDRLTVLAAPWAAINGNHDSTVVETAGHRSMTAGPLHLVLLDTSNNVFDEADEQWLDAELASNADSTTVVAIHHPPFETGIWWMDCVGLRGAERFERVIRQHEQVVQVLSGHVHRVIQTNWGACSMWVCPSTSVTVAGDVHPDHEPAETAESPSFSLHAYTEKGVVSHVVPVGAAAKRFPIKKHAPEFVEWVRGVQAERESLFK